MMALVVGMEVGGEEACGGGVGVGVGVGGEEKAGEVGGEKVPEVGE